MMFGRWWVALALGLVLLACGDDDGTTTEDAGATDAGLAPELTFEAVPDPDEPDGCATEPPAPGEARAKHVSCEAELTGGTVAMGRVGPDIVMENAVARYVIRGAGGSASFLGVGAGGLVDAAPQGGPDLIKEVLPFTGVSSIRVTDVVVTRATGDAVTVRALFELAIIDLLAAVIETPAQRVRGALDYELRADDPILRITARATTSGDALSERFSAGFAMLVGGAAELTQPFDAGPRAVLDGPGSGMALRMPVEEGTLGDIQSINFLDTGPVVARRGEETVFELELAVGETAAKAYAGLHASDEGLAELALSGAPGDRVEVQTAEGVAVLRSRLDTGGAATVPLPPGDYLVRSGFDDWITGTEQGVTLPAAGASLEVTPAPSGTLRVDVTAEDPSGIPEAAPVRVTVQQEGGGEIGRLVAIGPTDFRLPAGDYLVTVSRGPEFDWVQRSVTLADGDTVAIEGETLPRVVDTTGWVAGDFHLHSEMSTDSRHWLGDALRIVAAEGLEVVASTDHDYLTDYDAHVDVAGTDGWVLMVPGAEVSHPLIAHVNGYPLEVDPSQSANGTPRWFMASPGEWFDAIRARGDTTLDPAGALVQINHPRRSSSGLFESIGLDRDTGEATVSPMMIGLDPSADLNDFDVDSVEVWNKSPDGDDEESLLDYLALYSMGRRFAMMGNSDTHDDGRPAGSMRTYLAVPDDGRGGFAWTDVAGAIRERRATVSGGIFVATEVVATDTGADTVDLDVSIQAPPWIEVSRLRVYAGTEVVHEEAITEAGELSLTGVPLGGAGFVMVRVDGGRGSPVISHEALGMTNPLDVP